MNYATISADAISYTALKETEKRKLETNINKLIHDLSERKKQRFYGRLVQEDYIECAMDNNKYALRIAFLMKT